MLTVFKHTNAPPIPFAAALPASAHRAATSAEPQPEFEVGVRDNDDGRDILLDMGIKESLAMRLALLMKL